MRVTLLVLDGVFDSGLSLLLDTLTTANELAGEGKQSSAFHLTIAGLRARVSSAHGSRIAVTPIERAPRADVVVLPALGAKTATTIATALDRSDVHEAGAVLHESASAGARIAGACTATFVLASSGILDGRSATTTWWLSPLFRERFPKVTLDDARMVVESGLVTTAGAALAHVDLALWLVRRRSPSLANTVSRYLVTDERPSQATYTMPDHLEHTDPIVERFEDWARRHLKSFTLSDAARAIGSSERTLERRTQAVLGTTPVAYVRDLRVEQAVHHLRTTSRSLDEIATSVGYEDAVTLRRLLRAKTGRTVRELRAPARRG